MAVQLPTNHADCHPGLIENEVEAFQFRIYYSELGLYDLSMGLADMQQAIFLVDNICFDFIYTARPKNF